MKSYFTVGKLYKWVGPKNYQKSPWISSGEMDFICDGRRHLCTAVEIQSKYDIHSAGFDEGSVWSWGSGYKYIVECNASIIEKITDGINETL